MIKHGSKMIPGGDERSVPQITIYCGPRRRRQLRMCGRGFHPRFCFSWPNAKTAVMGGEQAGETMAIVTIAAASGAASRSRGKAGGDEGQITACSTTR